MPTKAHAQNKCTALAVDSHIRRLCPLDCQIQQELALVLNMSAQKKWEAGNHGNSEIGCRELS